MPNLSHQATPLRVLEVQGLAGMGGSEIGTASLAAELARKGVDVLTAFRGLPNPRVRRTLHTVPLAVLDDGNLREGMRTLRQLITDFAPDIVHSHLRPADLLVGGLGRTSREWAHVVTVHGSLLSRSRGEPVLRHLHRAALRRADAVTAISDHAASLAAAELGIESPVVIMNHVDVAPFAQSNSADWSTSDEVRLGWVGRLEPQKRPSIFVEFVASLRAEGVNAAAVIRGEGPLREAIASEAERLRVPLTILPPTPDEREIYSGLHFLLATGRGEAFGRTLVEAAAAGVFPLATRDGGHVEVLAGLGKGSVLLFDPSSDGDQARTRRAVVRLIHDSNYAADTRTNLARMVESFSPTEAASQYVSLFTSILDQ